MNRMNKKPTQDTLKIKRNSRQNPVFHYDRSKRMSMQGAPGFEHRGKRSLFKKNPSLKIILLDLGIIALLFFGMRFALNYEKNTGSIAGYRVKLNAIQVKDKLFTVLTMEKTAAGNPESGRTARVVYELDRSGAGETRELDLTRDTADLEMEVTLPVTDADQILRARITIGEETEKLSRRW